MAGASGLLSVMFPREFGTVDQFVVKGLLKVEGIGAEERAALEKMNPEGLRVKDGELLVRMLREKARENNELFGTERWTPRKVDMVLWVLGRG